MKEQHTLICDKCGCTIEVGDDYTEETGDILCENCFDEWLESDIDEYEDWMDR